MLFELIKKAYELNKENKIYLEENLNNIISILDTDDFNTEGMVGSIASGEHPLFVLQTIAGKKKKRVEINKIQLESSDPSDGERMNDPASFNSINPHANTESLVKISSLKQLYKEGTLNRLAYREANLYDPETPQQMLSLINIMEKFTNIDEDFSNENISVFLYPLSRGAKRLAMRPARIVGLTRELRALARQFDKLKNSKNENIDAEGSIDKDSGINLIKEEFRSKVASIKNKISYIINENPSNSKKILDSSPPLGDDETSIIKAAFKNKVDALKRQGWSKEDIISLKSALNYEDSFYKEI